MELYTVHGLATQSRRKSACMTARLSNPGSGPVDEAAHARGNGNCSPALRRLPPLESPDSRDSSALHLCSYGRTSIDRLTFTRSNRLTNGFLEISPWSPSTSQGVPGRGASKLPFQVRRYLFLEAFFTHLMYKGRALISKLSKFHPTLHCRHCRGWPWHPPLYSSLVGRGRGASDDRS